MQPSQTALRIGITIGLRHESESLWNNGIKQNAVFLAEALKYCANVASVTLVNTTAVAITAALPWDLGRWPTLPFAEGKDQLDVLIELGGQIDAAQTDYLKQRGCHLVSYCCGVEYVNVMESVLFNGDLWREGAFINERFDGIWMIPQVANISQPFFEVLRRQTAQVAPFVWDPVFLQLRSKDLPQRGEYRPRSGPRRLTVMEPNINVVKFCMYPVMIAEQAYRQRPGAIELLQVTNSDRLAIKSKPFFEVMSRLDIVRQHKAVFLGRHDTPQFLSDNTDIVISHQWENPLNYFYLEVCWQGYPLVHNATLCTDLGYYYQNNNVTQGGELLLHAIDHHDNDLSAYVARQRSAIQRFMPGNASVTEAYETLLHALRTQAPR